MYRALLCIGGRLPLPARGLLQVEDLLCISVTVEKRLEKVSFSCGWEDQYNCKAYYYVQMQGENTEKSLCGRFGGELTGQVATR
ncbi:unnamed protein product [Boreogadus saida]